MNNDLISRELLKKDIDAQISDFNELNKKGEPYKEFKDIRAILFGLVIGKSLIDNAPTVDIIPKGEYETACNVLLSLEQIVRSSDGWEESAVEAVHNAVQTAIKCMHERPQGDWRDNLIEVFRQSAEVGSDTFHLFEIERIINGEPM